MVIISKSVLARFARKHPDSTEALNDWWRKARMADWKSLSDVKQTFNSADYAGNDRYVFNIKGNRYRLVTMIFFDIRTVFVRFVGTHAAYDRTDASML